MMRSVLPALALIALLPTTPGQAATDLLLPPEVGSALQTAETATDIAGLVRRTPRLAATLMADAAALGIASPVAVLVAIAPGTTCPEFLHFARAAAEAAPFEADIIAERLLSATPRITECAGTAIASALINGIEDAGLDADSVRAEAAEILSGLPYDQRGEFAAVIAAATDVETDTAESFGEPGEEAIETADIATGAPAAPAPVTFVTQPGAAQNNPSPN
ncbi:MAG: hypothetical protein AAGJ28_27015 [Pseudomonadota bacterium]